MPLHEEPEAQRRDDGLAGQPRHGLRTACPSEAAPDGESRLRDLHAVLVKLTRSKTLSSGNLREAVSEITEAAAHALQVERASVWLYTEDRSAITCLDLYELGAQRHSAGARIDTCSCPAYFEAIASDRFLVADDAVEDARTSSLGPGYLQSLGIASLLDAPIRSRGAIAGIFCFEHVGPPRRWTSAEKSFAGTLADFASIAVESSHLAQAERTASLQAAKLSAMIDAMHAGVLYAGADGTVTEVNARFCALSGLAREQLLGRSLDSLARHHLFTPCAEHAARCRRDAAADALVLERPLGDEEVLLRVQPVRTAGCFDGVLVTLLSVTGLVNARRQAEAASQAKSEFLATISHEVRTPMSAVLGMLDICLQGDLEPEPRQYLSLARESADALMTLLSDILDFTRADTEDLVFDEIPYRLRDCIGDTLRTLSMQAHRKGLELIYLVEHDVPDGLIGDAGRLRQLLVHIIGNAIKFTDTGEVVVRVAAAAREDGRVTLRFTVRDTGIGIAPEKQKAVFEPFTQADGSNVRRHGGTGIGLSIAQRLVTMMEGRMEVESTPGAGSTFVFTITQRTHAAARRMPFLVSAETLFNVPVLIAAPHPCAAEILSEMLAARHMAVRVIASAAQAAEVLRTEREAKRPYPLMILDVPAGARARDALQQLVRNGAVGETRVVVLTAAGERGDAAACRRMGIAAYLTKPVPEHDLLRVLTMLIEKPPAAGEPAALITRHTLRETHRRLRILVAEDNLANQKLITHLLERAGHYVTPVSNGLAAVQECGQRGFDLVFMDIEMPGMNGLEAAAAIRKMETRSGGHIPIVALTAHALEGDRDRFLSAGMDHYIAKPFKAHELTRALDMFDHAT